MAHTSNQCSKLDDSGERCHHIRTHNYPNQNGIESTYMNNHAIHVADEPVSSTRWRFVPRLVQVTCFLRSYRNITTNMNNERWSSSGGERGFAPFPRQDLVSRQKEMLYTLIHIYIYLYIPSIYFSHSFYLSTWEQRTIGIDTERRIIRRDRLQSWTSKFSIRCVHPCNPMILRFSRISCVTLVPSLYIYVQQCGILRYGTPG